MAWNHQIEPYRHKESSGVLIFRVTVMLSCLILVPLAAVFGSAFPDLVKKQLVDRVKTLAGISTPEQPTPAVDFAAAPPYAPVMAETAPAFGQNAAPAAPEWQAAARPATPHTPDDTTHAAHTAPQVNQYATPAAAQMQMEPPVDHFTEIQHRLRAYGALHYALESVATDGTYRFHCTMSPVGAAAPRTFEAIDRDPLRAMAQVLSLVEAWRASMPANRNS